ncbi:MAG: flagellar assembly protein FliW [Provencibacterium sp.]|jgi:flagellar assembly factor FliW|nr:flagellar assembly protein FliW [Provencibacterium sp.]
MKIRTRDFGEMEIHESEIVNFRQPLFGFEGSSRYVFLHDDEISEQFVWLQSVDEEEVRFIMVDPATVSDSYQPKLSQETMQMLGDEEYMCWLIVVIPDDFRKATVNLKSPVVVNPSRMVAAQVILEEDFPIRFPLFHDGKEEL